MRDVGEYQIITCTLTTKMEILSKHSSNSANIIQDPPVGWKLKYPLDVFLIFFYYLPYF